MTDTPGQPRARLASLDGLRGVAAVVVVLHHLLLMLPQVASQPDPARIGSHTWIIENTPLKLLTAGDEAVLVFFVLSGMVLALPVLRRAEFDWLDYYPRRMVRLLLPVLAALALATVLVLVHHERPGTDFSSWFWQFSFPHPDVQVFVQAVDPFLGTNTLDNPLWSIRLELIFSLALPVYVLLAWALRRRWAVSLLVCFLFVFLGVRYENPSLKYLPVFFVGTLLAVHHDRLAAWGVRVRPGIRSDLAWLAVLGGGCTLLILGWLVKPFATTADPLVQLASGLAFLGALVVVAVAFLWRGAVRVLTSAVPRWLGRISFSLYLVHVPVLAFWANVFGPGHWPALVACTIPSALLVAWPFSRFVEQPAHRLSKRAGASLAARYRLDRTRP